MRNIIFLGLMLLGSIQSFCQTLTNQSGLAKTDYLQKSKDQQTAGWALLGGGAAVVLTGLIWNSGDKTSDGIFTDNFDTQAILVIIGATAMVASIPVFVSSAHNRKKSKAVGLKLNMEKNDAKRLVSSFRKIPSVSFKIPLGRR